MVLLRYAPNVASEAHCATSPARFKSNLPIFRTSRERVVNSKSGVRRHVVSALVAVGALCAVGSAQAAAWAPDVFYTAGTVVSYNGANYVALVNQTDYTGTGWNPTIGSLWSPTGASSGGGGSTAAAPPAEEAPRAAAARAGSTVVVQQEARARQHGAPRRFTRVVTRRAKTEPTTRPIGGRRVMIPHPTAALPEAASPGHRAAAARAAAVVALAAARAVEPVVAVAALAEAAAAR